MPSLSTELRAGEELELSVAKPAVGGRMIARHGRLIILLLGAIPGERVLARIERVERQMAFATTVKVLDASPDRRHSGADPLCGGCLYAHVAYARQLALKAQIIHDAFARLGRIVLDQAISVASSPERGYRMRARFHVRDGRVGFFREGTHDLCDAATTTQLTESSVAAVSGAIQALERAGCRASSVELAENMAADQRVAHMTVACGPASARAAFESVLAAGGLTGCSGRSADGTLHSAGVPVVADPLAVLTSGKAQSGVLERHAESFFQANRFLLPQLVARVLDSVSDDGEVLDLYAGVGLFSVSLAAAGRSGISAVEGDRTSGSDLQRNAAAWPGAVRVTISSVEDHLMSRRQRAVSTIIVDPPRTGISREAMRAVAAQRANRIIYISCDPATMARDARSLVDAGYALASLEGFDLFPNTPHVESLGIFER